MFKGLFKGGGSSSSSTWNALSSGNRADTVEVHPNVDSGALGLPSGYAHRTVTVPSEVFENLKAAGRANRTARAVLHAGASNQTSDIRASEGESWARDAISRRDSSYSKLKRAQRAQGGNCAVFASVAGAALHADDGVKGPLMRRRQGLPDGGGHEFLLIGDPREARWGDHHTVVVDPWPGHPSASTLENAVLHDSMTGESYSLAELAHEAREETWIERAPYGSDAHRMEAIQPMDQDEVNKQLRKMRLPSIGPELTAHALADTTLNNRIFDVRVATDPSTHYENESNGSTWTFDDITEDLLAHQARGRPR